MSIDAPSGHERMIQYLDKIKEMGKVISEEE
jgi:hypothetical protein